MLEIIAAERNRKEYTECGDNFQATSMAEINDFIRFSSFMIFIKVI